MSEPSRPEVGSAERFGRLYAELTDAEPTDGQLAAQRARLLMRVRREGLGPASGAWLPRPRSWVWAPVLVLTAAILLSLGSSVWRSEPVPLSAQWMGRAVSQGAKIAASAEGTPAELGFSDGSRILFEPETTGQMLALEDKRTEVRVLKGRVDADINRATGATWDVMAGPYRVSVIGTKFTVEWDPASERFAVDVTRGKVRVTGGDLGAAGVAVTAGQNVVREPAVRAPKATEVAQVEPAAEENEAATPEEEAVEPQQPAARAAAKRRPSTKADETPATAGTALPSAESQWRELSRSGRYGPAFERISALGFETVMGQANAEDLLLLANTARYAGRSQRARQAYEALRQRYPESAGARIAAFYLARLAQDANGQPREAVSWLRIYLREDPGGHLAATARARLIDTLLQLGDRSGARDVARDYIRLHPDGPHIGLARSLVRSSGRH